MLKQQRGSSFTSLNKKRLSPFSYNPREENSSRENNDQENKHAKSSNNKLSSNKEQNQAYKKNYEKIKRNEENDIKIIQQKPDKDEKIIKQKEEDMKQKKVADTLVYGNINNDVLGIRYGNTPYRWKYTGFRKKYPKNIRRLERSHKEDGEKDSSEDFTNKETYDVAGVKLPLQENNSNIRKHYVDGVYSKVSFQEQLEHVLKSRRQSGDHIESIQYSRRQMDSNIPKQYRRDFMLDLDNGGQIIGKPSLPSHLPEAEPILPGHTLLRPAMGMLKSSIKFPHRELENGAGVLGNYNNLGLKWDGRNERVLYTGFRRNAPNTRRSWVHSPRSGRKMLADYIMVVPSGGKADPSLSITNLVLDMNKEKEASRNVLKRLKSIRQPVKKNNRLIMYVANPTGSPLFLKDLFRDTNSVMTS